MRPRLPILQLSWVYDGAKVIGNGIFVSNKALKGRSFTEDCRTAESALTEMGLGKSEDAYPKSLPESLKQMQQRVRDALTKQQPMELSSSVTEYEAIRDKD